MSLMIFILVELKIIFLKVATIQEIAYLFAQLLLSEISNSSLNKVLL